VKELTEAMGGTVSVESEPGRLTTFTIRLGDVARIVSRA
jgi:signal transduction histidine kinase